MDVALSVPLGRPWLHGRPFSSHDFPRASDVSPFAAVPARACVVLRVGLRREPREGQVQGSRPPETSREKLAARRPSKTTGLYRPLRLARRRAGRSAEIGTRRLA